jgi:hypothetical protein
MTIDPNFSCLPDVGTQPPCNMNDASNYSFTDYNTTYDIISNYYHQKLCRAKKKKTGLNYNIYISCFVHRIKQSIPTNHLN